MRPVEGKKAFHCTSDLGCNSRSVGGKKKIRTFFLIYLGNTWRHVHYFNMDRDRTLCTVTLILIGFAPSKFQEFIMMISTSGKIDPTREESR